MPAGYPCFSAGADAQLALYWLARTVCLVPLYHARPCCLQPIHNPHACCVQEGLRVSAHKKVFREWTGLQRVQTLRGHEGVIWAIAFNATASHMATAGKDRVVRLWANRRAPQDRCALPARSLRGACMRRRLHVSGSRPS